MTHLRYSKHIELNNFGTEGQEKLSKSSVLIIGLGGLGSPVLQYLAGAGVGEIVLYDDDVVRVDNLHRQTIYFEKNVGQSKVLCARKYISQINSNVIVKYHEKAIDTKNIINAVSACDLVLDCTDNFRSRYMINDACYFLGKPLVTGAVTFTGGYFMLFDFKNTNPVKKNGCYRCLYPNVNSSEKSNIPSCSDAGVLGPSSGVIGCLMCNEAIKYLSEYYISDVTKINSMDMKFNHFASFEIEKRTSCELCGDKPNIKSIKESNYEKTWRQSCQLAV